EDGAAVPRELDERAGRVARPGALVAHRDAAMGDAPAAAPQAGAPLLRRRSHGRADARGGGVAARAAAAQPIARIYRARRDRRAPSSGGRADGVPIIRAC